MLCQFLRVPWNIENSHDRLGQGPSNDVTALNLLGISAIGLKFGGMVHSMMKQIAMKMAMLGQFLCIPRNFEISKIGYDQLQGTTLPL